MKGEVVKSCIVSLNGANHCLRFSLAFKFVMNLRWCHEARGLFGGLSKAPARLLRGVG